MTFWDVRAGYAATLEAAGPQTRRVAKVIEDCGDDFPLLMKRYAADRKELLRIVDDLLTGFRASTVIGCLAASVVRSSHVEALGVVELVADRASPEGTNEAPTDTMLGEIADAGVALARWQHTVLNRQAAFGQVPNRQRQLTRIAQTADALNHWYFPVDVFREAVRTIAAEFVSITGSDGTLWGDGLTGESVLDIHDAMYRLLIRQLATDEDGTLEEVGIPVAEMEAVKRVRKNEGLGRFRLSTEAIAAEANRPIEDVVAFIRELAAPWPFLPSAIVRKHAFRSDHPFRTRPLIVERSEVTVAELHSLGRAVLKRAEERMRNAAQRDAYNRARSAWVESAVAAQVKKAWGVPTVSNIEWSDGRESGEVDVAFRVGQTGVLVECKSHTEPQAKLRDVIKKSADQLSRIQRHVESGAVHSRLVFNVDDDGRQEAFQSVVRAPTMAYIVVLGWDVSSVTTAAAYYYFEADRRAPLVLSVADLFMITGSVERDDAFEYLITRYVMRVHPLAAAADEELLLAEFLSGGVHQGLPSLVERSYERSTVARYGELSGFLAWRNLWATLRTGPRPPTRASRDSTLSGLLSNLRAHEPRHVPVEMLLSHLWSVVGEDVESMLSARPSRPGKYPMVWVTSELPESGTALLFGIAAAAAEQLPAIEKQARKESELAWTGVHPDAGLVVVVLRWDEGTGEAETLIRGPQAELLNPRPKVRGALLRPTPPPTRNQQCWCGSSKKTKYCEPSHHTDAFWAD